MPGKYVIFDLDGVLAENKDTKGLNCACADQMKEFYKRAEHAEEITNVKMILCLLVAAGVEVFIFTSRTEASREMTTSWLYKHSIPFHGLFMRPVGNTQKPADLKEAMFGQCFGYLDSKTRVMAAFDDDPEVINMYKRYGVRGFLVV